MTGYQQDYDSSVASYDAADPEPTGYTGGNQYSSGSDGSYAYDPYDSADPEPAAYYDSADPEPLGYYAGNNRDEMKIVL